MVPAAIMTLLVALVLGAGPADASYRVGMAEQSAEMFSAPAWQDLRLKRVRYLVPWDWARTSRKPRCWRSWPPPGLTARTCS